MVSFIFDVSFETYLMKYCYLNYVYGPAFI